MTIRTIIAAALLAVAIPCAAADSTKISYVPKLMGAVRARWEWSQTSGQQAESRFAVRNARLDVRGQVASWAGYRIRADFCTYGKFYALDACAWLEPTKGLRITAGQTRIPLSAEGSTQIHQYIFADRSYIGRYYGNQRGVGVKASWTIPRTRLTVEGGVFNGATITDHDQGWQSRYTWTGRIGYASPKGVTLWGGYASLSPHGERMNQLDVSARVAVWRLTVLGEFAHRFYADPRHSGSSAYVAWAEYRQPLNTKLADALSLHARADGTGDYSNGVPTDDGSGPATSLTARNRFTIGVGASRGVGLVTCTLRLDVEHTAIRQAPAEDRIVAEFAVTF